MECQGSIHPLPLRSRRGEHPQLAHPSMGLLSIVTFNISLSQAVSVAHMPKGARTWVSEEGAGPRT